MDYGTPVPVANLVGETITQVKCGNPAMPTCGSYGAYTLTTASGRVFILWQSYGEVCLNQVLSATPS